MEGRFEFEGSEVLPLVDEAFSAGERLFTEAQRLLAAGVDLNAPDQGWSGQAPEGPETGAPPGLWLMTDRGVYLRSNAPRGGERVAHARGYRSDIPVEDEPICEFIDAAPLRQLRPDDVLVLTVTGDKIRLSLVREP